MRCCNVFYRERVLLVLCEVDIAMSGFAGVFLSRLLPLLRRAPGTQFMGQGGETAERKKMNTKGEGTSILFYFFEFRLEA